MHFIRGQWCFILLLLVNFISKKHLYGNFKSLHFLRTDVYLQFIVDFFQLKNTFFVINLIFRLNKKNKSFIGVAHAPVKKRPTLERVVVPSTCLFVALMVIESI